MEKKVPIQPRRAILFSFNVLPEFQEDGEHDFREKIMGGSFADSVLVLSNDFVPLPILTEEVRKRYIPKAYQKNYILKPLNVSNMTKHGTHWVECYGSLNAVYDLTIPVLEEAEEGIDGAAEE